jgi:hypothetical protein
VDLHNLFCAREIFVMLHDILYAGIIVGLFLVMYTLFTMGD